VEHRATWVSAFPAIVEGILRQPGEAYDFSPAVFADLEARGLIARIVPPKAPAPKASKHAAATAASVTED